MLGLDLEIPEALSLTEISFEGEDGGQDAIEIDVPTTDDMTPECTGEFWNIRLGEEACD